MLDQGTRMKPAVQMMEVPVFDQFGTPGPTWQVRVRTRANKKVADLHFAVEGVEQAADYARSYATEVLGVIEPEVSSVKRTAEALSLARGRQGQPVPLPAQPRLGAGSNSSGQPGWRGWPARALDPRDRG